MSEIDNTISRINTYEGVERILIIKSSEHDENLNVLVRSQSKIIEEEKADQNNKDQKEKVEVKEKKEKINYKDETPKAQLYAKMIPQIGKEARSFIRQLNSTNDLKFLRIRTDNHEILISPDKDYYLCVVQSLDKDKH
jgi:dynein light chain roadblock-type